jgi:hypothetical protein
MTTDTSATAEPPVRCYGVSHGNGNDGVSQMHANYYVLTDDPWTLARAAVLAEFKPGRGQAFALAEMQIDGEAEYTISATIYDPPEEDAEPREEEEEEDSGSWSAHNGAWHITEVFPEEEPREGVPQYDSLEDAFTAEVLTLAREEEEEPAAPATAEVEGPNLDCMAPEEVAVFADRYRGASEENAAELFPSRPDGFVQAARTLATYAAHKSMAMHHRVHGRVTLAEEMESLAERVFARLPEFARW